jgi:hypothetical protein|tara:strand:- start:2265 stop:2423 length:159 start_codon:yes stop_codon:yes gene_type:complete
MKRLRRNTRNRPIPTKEKLKVARKDIPINNVFSAEAMLTAVAELNVGGRFAK